MPTVKTENSSPNAMDYSHEANPDKYDSLMSLKIPRRSAFTPQNTAYPLQAKLAGLSKTINVRIHLSKNSIVSNSSSKSTPTSSRRHLLKRPTRQKFVTPTASSRNSNFISTPDPAVGLMVQYCRNTHGFEKFMKEAAEFDRSVSFVEACYAMVTNASATIPDVLHWSDDGTSFVMANVVSLTLFHCECT